MKTRVDVEFVESIQLMRKFINQMNFNDVVWYKNGRPVKIPRNVLREWKFTGLSNIDFVEYGMDGKFIKEK